MKQNLTIFHYLSNTLIIRTTSVSNIVIFVIIRVKELAIDDNIEEPFKKRPAVDTSPLDRIEESSNQPKSVKSPNNTDLALITSLCVRWLVACC